MKSRNQKHIFANLKINYFSLAKFVLLICIVGFTGQASATTRNAATEAEFNTAYTSSVAGDIINLTSNITFTSEKTISKTITINGNSFTISVAVPGLDDNGLAMSGASNYRVFTISANVIINNLNLKGGIITAASTFGAAIYVSSTGILYLNSCVLSNSRNTNASGGALGNAGTVFLSKTKICRNSGRNGGGFRNLASSTMYIENCSITENYTTLYGGGGGENYGTLYINNSTISNNQSAELGGGLANGSTGILYILNSSVTGNVAYGNTSYKGGGIANNGGTVTAINTLFAYNYHISGGTSASPTSYELDDVVANSLQNKVNLLYCIYHAALPSGTINLGSIKYNGLQNGSDNTIFTGGILDKITNSSGVKIGTASIFKPNLYITNGIQAPTIKTGSFLLTNKGTQTRFANNVNVSPVVAYYNLSTNLWVNTIGTGLSAQLVNTDQVNTTRTNPPYIGAIEANDLTFSISSTTAAVAKTANSTATVDVTAITTWTATSDQTWLSVNSGTGNGTLTCTTLSANPFISTRTATITVKVAGFTDKTIIVTQAVGDATLSISATTVDVAKTINSTANILVTSNTSWTATADQNWLTLNSGSGNGTLVITVAETNPILTTRSATVTIKATGVTDKTITVTQEAGDGTLTVSATSFTVGKSANSLGSIALTCTTSWTASTDQSWLLVKSYGSGNDAITLMTVTANPLAAIRQATITIKASGALDKTILVTQIAADATLTISANSASIAKVTNSTATINLTSNTIWTAASDQSWLTVTSGSLGNATVTFTTTTANPLISTRSATVTIKATGVTDKTIIVTQAAGDASLTVSAVTVSVNKNANSAANIDVTSNTTWTASSNQSWLQVISGVTGNATITLTAIEANPTVSIRSAIVTLKAVGIADKTITVSQEAGDPVLSASTSSVNIANNINSTATMNVTSNTTWIATSSQSWLTVDSGSTGNGTLVLTAKTNNPALTTRSAIVTLKAIGTTDISFEVIQEASLPTLTVSSNSVNIDPAASNTASVNINTNTIWTASSDQSWLTLSSYSDNNGKLTFYATNTTETRLAVVTLSAIGVSDKKINVIQSSETTQNKYQLNMTVTAIAKINDLEIANSDLKLSAYIGNECRGSADLKYVASYNRYMAFLLIWGNAGDVNNEITIKSYNPLNSKELTATSSTIEFVPDKITGSTANPFSINFNDKVTANDLKNEMKINIYPNPVTDAFRIDGLNCISTLSITDLSGRILLLKQVSDNASISVSTLPKGVYVLKISNNEGVTERKIVKQ